MSQPYVGEIRAFGFNFQVSGWAFCDGRLLSISQYDALFNLIGTTYGGDGQTTFGLPDLRGRTPVHINGSQGYVQGQTGGVETVILTSNQLPAHTHPIVAEGAGGNSSSPIGGYFAGSSSGQYAGSSTSVSGAMLQGTAGSQPHDNLMPYLCVNYSISLFGIFPSRS